VKKQTFVVLVALFSFVGSAFGLGLGDIDVRSNLNEPLVAEIQLIQLQGLTAGEVLPTLAGNDDFRRAGVERSFFLSNIQFRVMENDAGDVVVTLATRQAVREPFLNFLVEINWPGGRLLKEYTILLDPPVFDTGLAVDALVVQSSIAAAPTELQTNTVIRDNATEQVAAKVPGTPRDDTLPDGQYRVKRNDTLWEIALNTPSGLGFSPQQVMLAIQDLNPQAFLNNNINRVKAGSILTLPDNGQIAERTLDQAISEVKAQNNGAAGKLRTPVGSTSDVQLSASETTSSALPVGGETKNPDGYLELTSDSESLTTTAAGDVSAKVDELQSQLYVAEELNDQFALEKTELQSRVAELQEQIDIMERLLDIQNYGLAEVQQALVQTDAAQAVDSPSVESESLVVEVAPVAVAPMVTPAPAPVTLIDKVSAAFTQATGWVIASVTNMAITVLAALMVILLPLYIRNKRSSSDNTLNELTESVDDIEDIQDFSNGIDGDLLAELEEEFEESSNDELEVLDAVVEAEMYLAYQKYDQAEEKLQEAFSEHPERSDIGMKLLEVYAEIGDAKAFADLEERLALSSEQQYQAGQLRAKLPLGSTGGDDNVVDDERMISGLDLDLDLDLDEDEVLPVSDDFDLDFDDIDAEPANAGESDAIEHSIEELSLDAESDTNLMGSALDTFVVSDSDNFSNDLDFSLDLGDLDEEPLTSSTLDFSMEEELAAESIPAAEVAQADGAAEDELPVLDFSLEIDDGIEASTSDSLFSGDPELDLSTDSELDLAADDELNLSDEFDLSEDLAGDDDPLAELDDLDLTTAALLGGDADDEPSVEPSLDERVSGIDEGFDETVSEPAMDPLQQLTDSLDSDAELDEDEFDFLSGSDEASTKLDLARAYIEMDDKEGARDILDEVVSEGSDDQKAQAQELIGQL